MPAWPLAIVASAVIALNACSSHVVFPDDQGSATGTLAELRAELERLVVLTERADGEHSRSIEALRTELKDAIAALRADFAAEKERSNVRHELLRELLRLPEAASTKQIDALRADIQRLEARLDEIERDRKPPRWGTHDARIIVTGEEKSLFADLASGVIGAVIGGFLAIAGGLWARRGAQKHLDAQKRLDVAIGLIESLLSPTRLDSFAEVQWMVENAVGSNRTPNS